MTRRGHVSTRCRLSPEEELLVLDKATKVASIAAADAAKEAAKGAVAGSLGEQAGRYVSQRARFQEADSKHTCALLVYQADCVYNLF